jgi:type IV pilus assembly protein PilC
MAYKYRAYTTDKKIIQGTINVATENLAESALYNAGYRNVLSLEEVTPGFKIENLIPSLYGVKTREVIDFSNQLATLIQSGITILAGLRLLEGQTARKALKKVLAGLAEDIQAGSSLSQALMKYPQAFSNTYCQVVKASEQAGTLELGLQQAAVYLEKQANARQKLTRAMAYPIFVMLLAVGVSILLIIVALPPMVSLFNSFNAELPWTTRTLTVIANFVLDYRLAILIVIVALALTIYTLLKIPAVQLFKDKMILKIPVIGTIVIERSMAMFCQTAGMLLKAGLRLPPILDIVIQTNKNRVLRQLFTDVRESLVQGAGLSQPMSQNKLFPELLVEMVMVGEKTGVMDTSLATLAVFYENKADRKMDTLISMIEPALTVIIGLVVIFIALSVITPMYSILKSI